MKPERRVENQYCQPMSIGLDEKGQLEFCELQIQRENKSYVIRVATPGYIVSLKEHNLTLPEELQLDDNIFPLDGILNQEDICQRLSQIPINELEPYLNEPPKPKSSP